METDWESVFATRYSLKEQSPGTEAKPKQALAKLSCFIFVARSDASFIQTTLPPLFKMVAKVECKIMVILDASNAKGVLGENLKQSELSEVIEILKEIKKQHSYEMEVFSPEPNEVLNCQKFIWEDLTGRPTASGGIPYTVPFVSFTNAILITFFIWIATCFFMKRRGSPGLNLQSI